MASRQNYSSQVLNSQSTASSTNATNAKEKSSHNKSEAKLKHGKVIHKFTSESYLRLICEKSPSTASSNDEKQFIDKGSSSAASGGHIPMSSNTIINNMSKRKGTSFQITSVSVTTNSQHQQQGQRNSTDNNNGDDSCDDLDDSHTDDNISRITDYETPSISETFSGEDVFFTQPIAFGTAPVIPTSSQYGLAIVGPDLVGSDGSNMTDVHVSVTDAGINIMGGPISGGKQDVDHKNERFKVVKIESTEPFKRGRWMCMDYLDHTTLQDDGIDGKEGEEGAAAAAATKDDSNENNSAGSKQQILLGINNGDVDHVHSDNEELDHEVNRINSNNIDSIKLQQQQQHQQDITTHPPHHPSQQQQQQQNHHHPQTLTSIPNFNDHSSNLINNNQVAQSMPQGQIQMILTQEKLISHSQDNAERNLATGNSTNNNNGAQVEQVAATAAAVSNSTSQFPNSQPHYVVDQQQQQQQHAQTMTQEMIHSMMYQEQQQQQQIYHQGATLPTNILLQNIGTDPLQFSQQSHHQQQQQQQINSPISSNANALPPQQLTTANVTIPTSLNIALENAAAGGGENVAGAEFNSNNHQSDAMTNQFQNSQVGTVERNESDNQQASGGASLGTNENINISNNNSDNNNNLTISNEQQQQNASSTPSNSTQAGVSGDGGANDINESASNSVNNNNNATVGGGTDDGQAISEDNER
jgi:hypothetical protein